MRTSLWKLSRVVFIFLLSAVSMHAQKEMKFADYLLKYKNQSEVIVADESVFKIKNNKGKLSIIKEDYFESIILNEAGIKNFNEEFYDSELSPVLEYEAYTISKKGKKIKSNLIKEFANDDASIFYDEIKKKEVTYKSLEPGSKKVLKTKIEYKDPNLLSRYIFQKGLPSEKMMFRLEVDNDIEIGYKLFHDEEVDIKFTKQEKRKKTIYIWEVNDTEPFKYEMSRPGILYTAPHIAIYIKQYEGADQNANLLGTVDDLFQYYQSFVEGVNSEIDAELISVATSVTESYDTEEEKVKAIYYWVKDNIKYIAYENGYEGFIPREANLVCERKFGDCKDMSSIITAMCSGVGITNVYLTWIGSRDLPYTYSELPTPGVDNHMIAAYVNGDDVTFLDATDQKTRYGLPSSFIQGKEALIYISKDEYKLHKVPIVSEDDNKVTIKVDAKLDGSMIKGSGKTTMAGIARSNILSRMSTTNDKKRFNSIKGRVRLGSNKFQLFNPVEQNVDKRDSLYIVDFNYELDNYLVELDDEVYLNMFLRELTLIDEFEDDRIFPFVFEYKLNYVIQVDLEIPSNKDVGSLPEPLYIDNGQFIYSGEYSKEEDRVILDYSIKLKEISIEPAHFDAWNKSVKEIKTYMKQTITLKDKT
ncbi:MAG: ribosomal protein S18 [Saprospiraceae bacterium]|jgi:ribosomal protein S18